MWLFYCSSKRVKSWLSCALKTNAMLFASAFPLSENNGEGEKYYRSPTPNSYFPKSWHRWLVVINISVSFCQQRLAWSSVSPPGHAVGWGSAQLMASIIDNKENWLKKVNHHLIIPIFKELYTQLYQAPRSSTRAPFHLVLWKAWAQKLAF